MRDFRANLNGKMYGNYNKKPDVVRFSKTSRPGCEEVSSLLIIQLMVYAVRPARIIVISPRRDCL